MRLLGVCHLTFVMLTAVLPLARTVYLEGTLDTTQSFQPQQLLMYFDEPYQWPAVYETGLTCEQMISPPHILESNNQKINLDISQYWSGCTTNDSLIVSCEAQRAFESSRARWWYLAISRCQNGSTQGIKINYKIHMTNGDGLLFKEFSADEFYILQVDIVCLCALTLILLLASYSAKILRDRLMLHTTFKMYLSSLCFAVFFLFIECIAYGSFANNGVNNDGLKTFGHISEVISVLIFVLMLLLMGKGFTITRGRISTGGSIKIAIFMTLYSVIYAVLFFYQAAFFDPGKVLYIYESPPGYAILVMRTIAWVYFTYACFITVQHYPEKSKFFYPFYIFYSIWFLIGPVFVIIAYFAWPKYCRATIVNGVDNGITILAQAFLLFLTRPSNSNKNFPFHVRTSQIGILPKSERVDDFQPYPYAPSVNFTSHSGPDFSSIFNTAKDVDQQEDPRVGFSTSHNQPHVLRQIESGQVPLGKFPHENGDPFNSSAVTYQRTEDGQKDKLGHNGSASNNDNGAQDVGWFG